MATRLHDTDRRRASDQNEVTERYHVLGFAPEQIEWGTDGLPLQGAPHQTIGGISARGLQASWMEGQVGSVVDVTYSSRVAILHRPEPRTTADWLWHGATQTATVSIPVAVLTKRLDEDGNEALVWVIKERKTLETRQLIVVEWNLNSPNGSQMNAFAAQHNKVHTLYGQQWRMTSASLAPRDGNVYRVTVTWELDRGTPAVGIAGTPNSILMPGSGMLYWPSNPVGVGLIRDPFHELEAFFNPSDGPSGPPQPVALNPIPRVYQRRLYHADAAGWQTLPGVPPL